MGNLSAAASQASQPASLPASLPGRAKAILTACGMNPQDNGRGSKDVCDVGGLPRDLSMPSPRSGRALVFASLRIDKRTTIYAEPATDRSDRTERWIPARLS